jgi:hypothetical protein
VLLIARIYAGLGFALTEGTSSPRRLDKPQPMVGIVDGYGIELVDVVGYRQLVRFSYTSISR